MTHSEEFRSIRHKAGHTQQQAADYLYCSLRTIVNVEQNTTDAKAIKRHTEYYRLKTSAEGLA